MVLKVFSFVRLKKRGNIVLMIRIRRASQSEINVVKNFIKDIGFDVRKTPVLWKKLYVLDIAEAKYYDMFEIPVEYPKELHLSNRNVYSGGLYLGLIYRTREGLGFKPGLPLARRLSRLCKIYDKRCYVVNEEGEKRFLYGKPVPREMILNVGNRPLGIVINILGESLGWGRIEVRGGALRLTPIMDLGWYLRRGG